MGRDVSVQIRFGSAGRVVLAAVLLTAPVAAEDWPQFRGPTGQGHSSERGLPVEWSETSNIVWKTPVPGTGGRRRWSRAGRCG